MIDELIKKLERWSANQPDIRAVAIVGSHARGTARPDSDLDIVMICADPNKYLENKDWLSEFGQVQSVKQEDWGLVQSRRVFYAGGMEVEFGITTEQWCSPEEIELGTGGVINDGAKIIFDPCALLANLIAAVKRD